MYLKFDTTQHKSKIFKVIKRDLCGLSSNTGWNLAERVHVTSPFSNHSGVANVPRRNSTNTSRRLLMR